MTSVPQAKNVMRRAINDIVDPPPSAAEKAEIWRHFRNSCAYCGRRLRRIARNGHLDHADLAAGNHLGNIVLACASCNGDEKLNQHWLVFLHGKAGTRFEERRVAIQAWIDLHPAPRLRSSPASRRTLRELDGLVDEFGIKCAELRTEIARLSAPKLSGAAGSRLRR